MTGSHDFRREAWRTISALCLLAACGVTLLPPPLDAYQARTAPERPILLTLPVTPSALRNTLVQISVRTRTAFGLEVIADAAQGKPLRDRQAVPTAQRAHDLTGLALPSMLDRIMATRDTLAGQYEWQSGAIIGIRPVLFRNNRDVALNRVVPAFSTSRSQVMDLLFDVQRIFDAAYPKQSRPPQHAPARLRTVLQKPISITMANVSVRSILNEIVRLHGAMSWVADYQDPAGSTKGLRLSFVGFDNWSVSAPARKSP